MATYCTLILTDVEEKTAMTPIANMRTFCGITMSLMVHHLHNSHRRD